MAWTELTRLQYARTGGRYASDVADAEWALIVGFLPAPRLGGRPRTTDLRDVFDAILYIATTGCQWRMLPNDFPPVSTVRRYFRDWRSSGLLGEINRDLVTMARRAVGRAACPTAGVIDSQSVKTTESRGVCGFDAGKRIKGRKRHIVTDTVGLLVGVARLLPPQRLATDRNAIRQAGNQLRLRRRNRSRHPLVDLIESRP